MNDTRKQVMTALIEEAMEIQARGQDSFDYLTKKYPDMPIEIATQAWLAATDVEVEKWWLSVEKTIDGEVIKNALARA